MTKKIVAMFLIVGVVIAMVACAAPTAAPTQAPTEEPTEPPAGAEIPEGYVDTSAYAKEGPYTFCFSNASVSNSWRVSMVEHVRYAIDEAKEAGLIDQYFETDANDDETKQIADIEDLLTKGCDVLIVSAATSEALTPVVEKAMDQGVPVVTLDRNIASDKYVTFVEQDSCDMGRRQAEWLVEALGGEGNVVLLSGLAGATPAEDRLRCARETLLAGGLTELAQEYSSWSPVEGKRIMEAWITTYGDQIDGVWSDSGLQGSGAVEAFVEAGMDVPPITGEDFNRYLKQWKEMGFEGVAVSFSVRMGYEAVQIALDVLAGEPVPHYVSVEPLIITSDNLDEFVRMDLPDDYWAASMPEVAARLFPEAGIEVIPEGYVDTSAYAKEPPYTVCFSNASVSNSWRVSMVEHVRYAVDVFTEQGLIDQYFETDANDDETKQIADIEDLLTKGCDVLIVSAATSEALTPVVESAMAQGVPVVTVDRNIASDQYVTFVEQDSCDMGRRQAEWLVEAMGGEGNVVLLSGLAGATPAEDRLRCARETLLAGGLTELAQEYSSWSPVEGKRIMEAWITTYGDQIDGVWSDSGLQGSGAVEAFVEAGMDVPPITGEDFNRYLKQWKEMGFDGVAVSFSVRMGYTAVEIALDVLAGEPVPHYVSVEPLIITSDNLDEFVRMDLPDDYWAASMPEVAARLFPED